MEQLNLDVTYIEEMNQQLNSSESYPEKVKPMIKDFLIMVKPVALNQGMIDARKKMLIDLIKKETDDPMGWLYKTPLGQQINEYISIDDTYVQFSREEVNALLHLVEKLYLLLEPLMKENQLHIEQLKIKEKVINELNKKEMIGK